ncbi:transposase family protein [Streptomyces sp. NPDC004111]|uniref:transposase family protein n=1 Tax=Streptomyces sp. NPDC004111 TaxID=3364690 RepID=UPI00367B631D
MQVLAQCRWEGLPFVVLDGTLVRCARAAGETERGTDLWYAIRIKHFVGKVQSPAAPEGTPLWVSDVEPGSSHDLAAARSHALPDLCRAAAGQPATARTHWPTSGTSARAAAPTFPSARTPIGRRLA